MGFLKDAVDVLARIPKGAGNLILRIPVVDDALVKLRGRYLNPVVVSGVNFRSADLLPALDLYDKALPQAQRFESADIARWLRENEQQRKAGDRTAPIDAFIVAKFRGTVCGFVLFHYFPKRQVAFFAYMAVDKRPGIPKVTAISDSLMKKVARLIKKKRRYKGCNGFVFEVEDPRLSVSSTVRNRSIARIRRFSTLAETLGFSLRAVDIHYLAPPLTHIDGNNLQEELLLMIAGRSGTLDRQMPRERLVGLLEFIYIELYPGGYSSVEKECILYRAKCQRSLANLIDSLPGTAHLLDLKELIAPLQEEASV